MKNFDFSDNKRNVVRYHCCRGIEARPDPACLSNPDVYISELNGYSSIAPNHEQNQFEPEIGNNVTETEDVVETEDKVEKSRAIKGKRHHTIDDVHDKKPIDMKDKTNMESVTNRNDVIKRDKIKQDDDTKRNDDAKKNDDTKVDDSSNIGSGGNGINPVNEPGGEEPFYSDAFDFTKRIKNDGSKIDAGMFTLKCLIIMYIGFQRL